jgi:hypothetical protein
MSERLDVLAFFRDWTDRPAEGSRAAGLDP